MLLLVATDFNPLAPRGARHAVDNAFIVHRVFQSTSSSRSQTLLQGNVLSSAVYFNPLAPRGARQKAQIASGSFCDFNPLAPRGARHAVDNAFIVHRVFQSTSSSRSQTLLQGNVLSSAVYFNPLAPRGARPVSAYTSAPVSLISIH